MGLEDEVMSHEPHDEFTFKELNTAFHELLSEYKKVDLKIKSLKNSNDILMKEKEDISEKKF